MPGPPPKPSARRDVSGDPGKRSRNRHEPKPEAGSVEAPAYLSAMARAIWDELTPRIAKMKCLGDVDQRELATACRLQAMGDHYATVAEAAMAKSAKRPSPALWAAVKCWEKAAMKFYRFGVTPAERTRIVTGGGTEEDAFGAYRKAKRAAGA